MDHTELDQKTQKRIIRDLSRRRSKDLIIEELCQSAGLTWSEAEQIVGDIETYNSIDIYGTQRLVLALLGGLITLGGFLLSGSILLEAVNGAVIRLNNLELPYPNMVAYFIIGLLMMTGGIRGIVNLLKK